MTRGERRNRTTNTVRRRVRSASSALIFGIDRRDKIEPHRVHKHKPKFTSQHSSMKEMKQQANRASRHRANQAVRSGREDMPVESRNSVRWGYW